jgi:hypothetical protein
MILAFGEGEDFGNVIKALEARPPEWQRLGSERSPGSDGFSGPTEAGSQERVDLLLEGGPVFAATLLQRRGYIGIECQRGARHQRIG